MAGECRAGRRLWVEAGRSSSTVHRAEAEGLEAMPNLAEAASSADLVVSICPPDSAVEVASAVAEVGYRGLYLDANAISPATMAVVASRLDSVVDGGVIGPPPNNPGTTRLYLASSDRSTADWVAELWTGSNLGAVPIDVDDQANPFPASALKMVYAAWTKGSAALLTTVVAAAAGLGVDEKLKAEWDLSQPGLVERAERTAAGVAPKAWRFKGEMTEIAATFADAGVPDGFWRTAEEVYEQLSPLKHERSPGLDEVINLLIRSGR